jgi:nucleoside-diphosphate kinase
MTELIFFSFGILKPDCIQRELVQEAFRRISISGFDIVISKTITLTEIDVLHVYSRCVEKPFFDSMKQFLTSSDCIVFIVKSTSNDAIEKLNNLVGFMEPMEAKVGTLRELGKDITNNLAHSSNNSESFINESGHFFSKQELIKAGLNIDYYYN